MAVLPLTYWIEYTTRLRQTYEKAEDLVRQYIAKYRIPQTYQEFQAFIDYAYAVSTKYGEAAAEVAAVMYEQEARASKVSVPDAVPAQTPEISEVAKAVRGTAKTGNADIIASAIGRLVKRTAVDTTMQNAIRDGAEWAWIPQGDTCSFCIMLASNGWQKASKAALKGGHAEHIHANCDCTYAVRFNGQPSYEGYDPDKYRETYDNAEGDTWQEKLNSMRRDEYAKNADMINARKRDLYAEKQKARGISNGINSRTPGYGRPVNVALESAPLNQRQKKILEKLTKYDERDIFNKRDVSMQDLAALTAHTGVEFAMFTRKGERLVIRGDANSVNVLPEYAAKLAKQGYRWSGHTHPGNSRTMCVPSPGDRNVLRAMKQKRSSIYNSTGICYIFDQNGENDEYTNL